MNLNYFDVHSHLNFSQFDEDREEVIQVMKNKGIWTICVGTDEKTSRESIELAQDNKNIYATVGVHPTDWQARFPGDTFRELASHDKVVAIGECGLDYYRDQSQQEEQKELFISHIKLAIETDLPLMIHGRPEAGTMTAYEDILDILKSFKRESGDKVCGNVHFFVGTIEIAREFLDLDFSLSFDGPITFTSEFDEVIKYAPLNMIMAETDSPFAAPQPHRGERNSPLYIEEIVEKICATRPEGEEEVRHALLRNAAKRFSIPVAVEE